MSARTVFFVNTKHLSLLLGLITAVSANADDGRGAPGRLHVNKVADFACTEPGGLATPAQIERERALFAVVRDPRVTEATLRVEGLYGADAQARDAAGKSTIAHAAASIVTAMAEWGVMTTHLPASAFWTNKTAHAWFGMDVPNSGYGIENPDNVYRQIMIDPERSYEIRGVLPDRPPVQQSFILYKTLPGTRTMSRESADIAGVLDAVTLEPDNRSFVVTVDRQPANGRKNHLRIDDTAAMLIVRDTLSDWAGQMPVDLEVRVTDPGIATPTKDPHETAVAFTLELLKTVPAFWIDYDNTYLYSRPANEVVAPRIRPSGWGASTGGHFALADNEVLVVTLDDMGAGYVGFQLADVWGVALDYVHRTGSLSSSQAKRNRDGSITYVIAAHDPGHHNWLDSSDLQRGIFAIRWQALAGSGNDTTGAVISAHVEDIDRFRNSIDPDLRMDSESRLRQLSERERDYLRRTGC